MATKNIKLTDEERLMIMQALSILTGTVPAATKEGRDAARKILDLMEKFSD